ncbi:MAG: cation:proton antiporter [Ardenticatenaceae bacterium]|nr:cation:proton antiporter [Ardenticatenaceae bacterium]MCB8986981.1 cation:proton antiporter [Ardenticatenaceae bacterium]
MANYRELFIFVAGFVVIALASRQIGAFLAAKAQLPLISGFLLAGVVAGPYVLDLIPAEALEHLRLVDQLSLAVIAFAAGSELYLEEMRSSLRSISWVVLGNVLAVPVLGTAVVLLLADYIPFMREMDTLGRLGVSLMIGAILVARSPSSAIAIINELRAKGPFSKTVLGVTMVTDVAVIILFAISLEVADALLTRLGLNLAFLLLLAGELMLTGLVGLALGWLMAWVLAHRLRPALKIALLLGAGLGTFLLTASLREVTAVYLPFEILLEPLLICLIGSFWVTNYTPYRAEFLRIIHDVGPPTYVLFFTLTGASLALDVLATAWLAALALFIIRLVGIFLGSLGGGMAAGDPMKYNRLSWMTYVTMAGVGLGLAKEAADIFPEFGIEFATVVIAVIVVSQLVGPPLFKWAIVRSGEARPRHETPSFDGVRDALIFGLRPDAVLLARQLGHHGWQVKVVCLEPAEIEGLETPDVTVAYLSELSVEALRDLGMAQADAIVAMQSDELNYQICELAYEHFGTPTMVAYLLDRSMFEQFYRLGVSVVEPQTAVVSLLDHFVRAPVGTSMLLGMRTAQDVVDVELRNPDLHGLTLRDLRLPLDILVLSVQRNGETIISRGYTRLELGDRITMVGSVAKLEEVMVRFGN